MLKYIHLIEKNKILTDRNDILKEITMPNMDWVKWRIN
jgi:hypothetical protein